MVNISFKEVLKKINYAIFGTYKRMEEETFSPRFAMQTAICYSLYKDLSINIDELQNEVRKIYRKASDHEIKDILKDYELYEIENRNQIIEQAKNLIEDFYYMVREKNITRVINLTEEIRRIVFQRKFTTPDIRVRFMFFHLLELLKTEDDYKLTTNINRLSDQLKKMGDVYTRKLFVQIFDSLSNFGGYGKEVSLQDTILESKSNVDQIIASSVESDQQDIYKEYLRMKDALIVVSEQLDSIRDDYLAYQEQGAQEAKREFFTKLNSEEHNRLLDTLAISNHLLSELSKKNWKPENSEVESVIFSIKAIIKAFQSFGLTQTTKIGEKIKLKLNEVKNFNYLGSEFKIGEEKLVEIQSTGWRLGDLIISLPRVKEVKED